MLRKFVIPNEFYIVVVRLAACTLGDFGLTVYIAFLHHHEFSYSPQILLLLSSLGHYFTQQASKREDG